MRIAKQLSMADRSTEELPPPKRARGRTAIQDTPVATRSRIPLPEVARRSVEQRLRRAIAPFGTRIQRASIRFEDVNGPRGGVDIRCAIKLVVSGTESIVVEERAASVREAVARVIPRVARAVRRHADRSGKATPRATLAGRKSAAAAPRRSRRKRQPSLLEEGGSIIGKRAGRSEANLEAALERPEKIRRDAYTDTAEPGVSASDRKAGGQFTARRNSRRDDAGMTYALEDSRGKPSRKSTRGSANRQKAATQLSRRVKRNMRSPAARAARAAV